MAAHGFVAVVGSRELPEASALQVTEVVRFFLARGWGVGSGGARGADQFALEAVVAASAEAGGRAGAALGEQFKWGPRSLLSSSRLPLISWIRRRRGGLSIGNAMPSSPTWQRWMW